MRLAGQSPGAPRHITPALPTSDTVQLPTEGQRCETTPPQRANLPSEDHSSEDTGEQDASYEDAKEQEESDDEDSEDKDSEDVNSDKEDHLVEQIGKACDEECSLVQPIPTKRRYSLRNRSKTAKFHFSYPNEENTSFQEQMTISIFEEDLFSVEPCQPLTASILDYVIYKRIARGKNAVYPFGCSLFAQIEHVDQSEKSYSAVKDLVDEMEWTSYPFVLIPISGLGHWSLLVVEQPLSDIFRCYYVDSVEARHQSNWAIKMESKERNNYDCGIYMLYCMDRFARYIVDKSPITLLDEIKKLTGSCTASKADKFRATLRGKSARAGRITR